MSPTLAFGHGAGELSKDVFKEAGKDAAMALGKYYFADTKKEPELKDALGSVGGLVWKGVSLYDKAPEWGRSLGERLNRIKGRVYGTE